MAADPARVAAPGRGYDLVLLDFDGTLADSARWLAAQVNDVAARFGFRPVDAAEMEALRACDAREIIRRLGVPAWKLPAIGRHLRALALAQSDRIALFPGVAEALAGLAAAGARTGIVSSNGEAYVRAVLGAELAATIGYWGCGASLFGKARRLRGAVRRMGVAPARAIYVGDERRDVAAARAAGIACAAVRWGYATPAALAAAGPDRMLGSVAELLEL